MKPIVTAEQIRVLDNKAINIFKIPGCILMENAALNSFYIIENEILEGHEKTVLILCGVGNNGGDGFALARHFIIRNFFTTVVVFGNIEKISPDAKLNLDILLQFKSHNNYSILFEKDFAKIQNNKFDLIVDALLGTGLNSSLNESFMKVVKWANVYESKKICLDIPTGLNSNTGFIMGDAFISDFTITMGFIKAGLLINDGPKYSGEIFTANISFPVSFDFLENIRLKLIEKKDIRLLYPKRNYDSHKYSVGKVVIVGGSKEYTGAPILAAEACMKSGCGGVVVLSPENLINIYAGKLKEVMYFSTQNKNNDYLSISDYIRIKNKLDWADVILIGPGLGQNESTSELVKQILIDYPDKKKVIDADGLNLISQMKLENFNLNNCIFTPHLGEFSRLTNLSIEEIKKDYVKYGSEFSIKNNCTLILKGAPSFVFSKFGFAYINSTGNPGMATIGMGDVLSGIVAGLFAQDMDGISSALFGTYIHGLSGDIAFENRNIGLIASDVTYYLPQAISDIAL